MKFERYGIGLAKGMVITFRTSVPPSDHHPISGTKADSLSTRTRGNELVWDNVKCTGCTTCARSCPQGAIHITTSPDPKNNKYDMIKIEVDTGYCISCGLCVESCPYSALHMGYSYERAKYRRGELVQANEMLLVISAATGQCFYAS